MPSPPPPPPGRIISEGWYIADPHKWKKWFAWYPVKVHNERAWLKFVYRRRILKTYSTVYSGYVKDNLKTEWKYGTILDVLGNS